MTALRSYEKFFDSKLVPHLKSLFCEKNDTSYDSAIWTAKGEDQIQFNSHFWSANVTEVCLTSTGFGIQLPVKGPSLRSLFFENITLEIPIEQWIDGIKINISHLNFTNACFKSGFNVGDPNSVRVRLGVVSVAPHAGCSLSVKAIGVGIKVAGKDYGSVHGLYANTNNHISDVSYQDVTVYVRSRPDPSETVPTMMMP
ncbi:Hypothetical predicted protein [Paramuricea clavata]|uniref:Uncharacterized protein n=1 Tax=Paramuricea clavata TaxID=317549 RepID=A0A6S7JSN5_PARCT|nr:Hypothetical predicted protein [Paramuricea clavata]